MIKSLKKKIESNRRSKSHFWRMLVRTKDTLYKLSKLKTVMAERKKNRSWHNHENLTREYERKLYESFMPIVNTRPIACNPLADTEIHTVTGHHHLFMYLLAVKSLLRFHNDVAVVAHDGDGDLTEEDISVLKNHIPGMKIISRADADAKMGKILNGLNNSQRYRSQVVNSLELLDNTQLTESEKIITMNSDVLFFEKPTELIDWISGENRDILYVHEENPSTQEEFLFSINCGFPRHVTIALACSYKEIYDLHYIDKLLGSKIARTKPWPIGQCIYPALFDKASDRYNIRSFDVERFDASGVFREGSVFRHYWSSTGRFTELQIIDSMKVIHELT